MKFILLLKNLKAVIFSAAIICIITGCSGKKNIRNNGQSGLDFRIVQDGIEKDIINNEAAIYRKPFTIEFRFTGKENVFINASFNSGSFRAAGENRPVNEISGFRGTVITEELFNSGEILTISDTNQNFWHYSNENDHSFNEVKKENGRIICIRKISSFQTGETEKNRIKLTDVKEEALYLIFMKLEWNKDFSRKIEKNRRIIKLTFMDVETDEIPLKNGTGRGEKPKG